MRHVYLALLFGFLLGIQNGYITLWKDGQPDPVRIFPYRAEMLPLLDQASLEKGIHIQDDSRLMELLEDYLS